MTTSESWTTIESDPGVFTELISSMGCSGVEVAELWSCDRESLAQLEPVYGLIFLFRWQKETQQKNPDVDPTLYFAKQVIPNACATQALVSVLMNIPETAHGFQLGRELTQLKSFTADFPPDMKGLALGNCEAIRTIHNSFRPPQSIVPEQDKQDQEDGEAFHFVAYIPHSGGLYELDGLQPGPLRLCDCSDWLGAAAEAIRERISLYASGEQRFNLMAVVRSRKDIYEEELERLDSSKESEEFIARRRNELRRVLEHENVKRRHWKEENLRRRTDYTPFAFHLLTIMAERGQLREALKAAQEK